ncbi:MAG: DUF6754 domain-containing protein [Chloroflexota bacterium]
MNNLLLLGLIIVTLAILWLLARRIKRGDLTITLRPLAGYQLIQRQIGQAVESGSTVHMSMGRASLIAHKAATSFAALQILDFLAEKGGRNNSPPAVTVGEGTLLPAAEDSLRQQARYGSVQPNGRVQFVADENHPFAFASGVVNDLERKGAASYVATGHQGAELALIGFAAQKNEVDQLVATDDPAGLAVATAVSEEQLIGEDIFAAGAYLSNKPHAMASLLLQDVGRWLIAAIILVLALVQLFT